MQARHKAPGYLWENELDLNYGGIRRKGKGVEKSDDRAALTSSIERAIDSNFSYSGGLSFRTQFAPGYEFPLADSVKLSGPFSPAYIELSLGIGYQPAKGLTVTLSPVSGKSTIVTSDLLSGRGAYGVEKGKHVRQEYGGSFKLAYKGDLAKNITLSGDIHLFSNYANQPLNMDVNGNALLSFKVNEYISTTLKTNLIYDEDIEVPVDSNGDERPERTGPRVQFKEVFSLGLSYSY